MRAVALDDDDVRGSRELVEPRAGAGVAGVADHAPTTVEDEAEAAKVGYVLHLHGTEAQWTGPLPRPIDLDVTDVENLVDGALEVRDRGDAHHVSEVVVDAGRPHDKERTISSLPQYLEEQEGPAEGVVGVEVRDDDRLEALDAYPTAAKVRQHRGGGLDQNGVVEHEAVPVPPRSEEVAGAQERKRCHTQTTRRVSRTERLRAFRLLAQVTGTLVGERGLLR